MKSFFYELYKRYLFGFFLASISTLGTFMGVVVAFLIAVPLVIDICQT